MAGKKKDMNGGKFFNNPFRRKSPDVPLLTNVYLNQIKNLASSYEKIQPRTISVNNLNTKVKSLNKFAESIKNKNGLMPLLDHVKLILIEKIKLSISEFISSRFTWANIEFPELLGQLQEFEKLLNQLKLLDDQFDLSLYNPYKQGFIDRILDKYENYIQSILFGKPNINILQQLYQEVQNYIREYSEFIESITNNKKRNNPIYEIINRLNNISDQISTKISRLSSNIKGYHQSNSMKRIINLLYDTNKYQKGINYNSIFRNLLNKYKNNNDYSLKKISSLAEIRSTIESITRMPNSNNKNILLNDLREKIIQSKKSLGNYSEFQEYERIIIPS